jgi:hypothetical protein
MSATATPLRAAKFGKALYQEMREHFDYSQITWTMKRYNAEMSQNWADELVDAFLQWVSLVPTNQADNFVVMFQSPIEEAFHSFVLNTRLYSEFCERFLGEFFHHDPLVDEAGPEVERLAWYTVEALEKEFGDELHPELRQWRTWLAGENYKVACVGPGGHCHV